MARPKTTATAKAKRRTVRTPSKKGKDWASSFLAALAATGNVSGSARSAGVGRRTAYDRRAADESFAAAWGEAMETACDALEAEARRRAHDGVRKPVYQGGKKVGEIREYSDTLLIFLLKGRRREVFGDRVKNEVEMDVAARIEVPDADPRFVGEGGRPAEAGDRGGPAAEGADALRPGGDG